MVKLMRGACIVAVINEDRSAFAEIGGLLGLWIAEEVLW